MYDYFSFLQAHELDWREVDRGEAKSLVATYRDDCLITCNLALNTTRRRLLTFESSTSHSLRVGWVKRLSFAYERAQCEARNELPRACPAVS